MMFGIRMIPYGMRYVAEAMVSLRSINAFLLMPDVDTKRAPPIDKSLLVQIRDASFVWETVEETSGERLLSEMSRVLYSAD